MSAHLLIHDSAPQWWLSPDIWVVPGNDPNGPPGSPIAGTPAYLWARVSNLGNVAANGTRIDFYWANPSAQMVVGVATPIGSAYADLAPGDTQEVLCLVPWKPVIVNGGHECVLAVAHGPGDDNPLPDPLPNGYAFDPPKHDQIAQLNLGVVAPGMMGMPLAVMVNAIGREDKRVTVSVDIGGKLDERTLAQLGYPKLQPARERHVQATLSLEARCCAQHDPTGKHTLEVHVPRGRSLPVFVTLHADQLPHDQYQLVHVTERRGDTLLGGVSYLVVPSPRHTDEEPTS